MLTFSKAFTAGLFAATIACLSPEAQGRSASPVFTDLTTVQKLAINPADDWIKPNRYRAVSVDLMAFRSLSTSTAGEIILPMPDGTNQRFTMIESSIMEPGLQAKFPGIRTYMGQGIDDPTATLRISQSPHGFHAQILSAHGSVYIDPRTRDRSIYASYYRSDLDPSAKAFSCGVPGDSVRKPPVRRASLESTEVGISPSNLEVGSTLKTYRLAVATTVEYTEFHGGTTNGALAAIVATMARVNGVYERELSVRMVLVDNNEQIIYTVSDSYSNDDGDLLLGENQTNIDAVIGVANYDIGHVFSTGGGGIASLGSVCESGFKAQGVTGSSSPEGDPYDIDYVAHEIGHQFGANHTFNSQAGSCGGGNRNSSTAYEPGSGSTIMAYAGICDADDLQSNSDDHFHSASFDEMVSYITLGGGTCGTATGTGNNPPVIDAGSSYTIPAGTPFFLTATGSDPDGDTLTYAWEQRDLGPSVPLGTADNGSSPLFRAFKPDTSPSRSFPGLSNVIGNVSSDAEILPSTSRTMNFRVTARDNRAGGGGVSYDETFVTVDGTKGPFVVTSFNAAGTNAGITTVNWDVAGTAEAPVNTAFVKIMLSTNGGLDFPVTLNASAPNTGSALVVLPNITTDLARIKVQGSGNIFYDINDANFSIRPATEGIPLLSIVSTKLVYETCLPTNGAVDPGETVRMEFNVQNFGTVAASNVLIELVATNGVLLPDEPAFADLINPGEVAIAEFTFTAGGVCGDNINPQVLIQTGTNQEIVATSLLLGAGGLSTHSFTDTSSISIQDATSANPYPAIINVSGLEGTIAKVTVTLSNVNHEYSYDIDALLTGPEGQSLMLMSYCAESSLINATFTFDDSAAQSMPFAGVLNSGEYKPTDYGGQSMPGPAPTGPYGSSLAGFIGANPNGDWRLYVRDVESGGDGSIASGWSISLDVESVICCEGEPPASVIYTASFDSGPGSLSIVGAGGVPYATNYLYATTNMMTPVPNWSRIGTNVSDVNGLFDITGIAGTNAPQGYFMIQSP